MLSENPIKIQTRIKELFFDLVFIWIYLGLLFGVMMLIYHLFLGGIPEFSETSTQVLTTFTSVIPMILIFSFLDYRGGSFGKRRAGLILYAKNKTFMTYLIRNIVKFIPWQLAHVGLIRGLYTEFDIPSNIVQALGSGLMILMLAMGLLRKDKRHLADLLAGTQVQNEDK